MEPLCVPGQGVFWHAAASPPHGVQNSLPLLCAHPHAAAAALKHLALTFKQFQEQAVSLELPQEMLMSFLSPRSPHWIHLGTAPRLCSPGSWEQLWERHWASSKMLRTDTRSPFSSGPCLCW